MLWRGIVPAVVACLFAADATPGAAATCEVDRPIVFAGLDWDSNAFHTAVARHIIETGYGCKTEEIPGSTLPLLTGMARGDIDVTMEIWIDNVTEPWNKALAAGQVVDLGVNFPDAIQGWFVPRYLVEGDPARNIKPTAPGLKKVSDLPKHKALFRDPEEPDKGRFHNCILGWSCEIVNSNKLKAYKLLDHYTNFKPGTGAALAAAIASQYKRGKPFLAYYWGPTWLLGKYDLMMLEEPAYNKADWDMLAQKKGEHARPVAYPVVVVTVGANKKFADKAPGLVAFLAAYETSNAMVSKALAFVQEKKGRTARDAALNFLKTQQAVWTGWVPADVADRVKASLN